MRDRRGARCTLYCPGTTRRMPPPPETPAPETPAPRTPAARDREDLTRGPIARKLIWLAAPMAFGNLAQTALSFIDTIFVGRLGAHALAGVGLGTALLYVIWTLLPAIAMGAMAIGSRAAGAGDTDDLGTVTAQALWLGLVLWIGLAALGLFGAPAMIGLLSGSNAAAETMQAGITYTRIIFVGSGLTIVYFMCATTLRATGDAITPMISNTMACALNIVLDPIFIFGWGPVPAMGVAGAAYATVLSNIVNVAYILWRCTSGDLRLHLRWHHFRLRLAMLRRIVRLALPNSVQYGLETVTMLAMMRIVAGHGDLIIAAYTIGIRLDMMVLLPGWAISQGGASFVGQNLGANEPERARRGAWTAFGLLAVVQGAAGLGFILFAPGLVGLFTSDVVANADLVSTGASYLRTVPWSYVFLALGMTMANALTGAGDTVAAMWNVVRSRLLLQLPVAWLLPRLLAAHTDLPPYYGLWIGVMVGHVAHGLLNARRFSRGHWQHREV